MEKPETEGRKGQPASSLRWLYFFLGVFLAASLGLAIALIVVELNDNGDQQESPGASTERPQAETKRLCTSSSCVLRAGELLAAMDRTVDPCQDFYTYSCGNWIRTHSIPESQSAYTRFGELRDSVRLELKDLLEQPYDSSKEGTPIKKLKRLYQSCIDEDKLAELGVEPMKQLVNQLGTWPLTSPGPFQQTLDLESVLVNLSVVNVGPLLDIGVYEDDKNSSLFIPTISQPTFGLDREYLIMGRNSTEVVTYEELLHQLAMHVLGLQDSNSLKKDISDVVEFEIELAKMSASRSERRDSERFYKKLTISELQTTVPKLKWMKYLTAYFQPANITVANDTPMVVLAVDYLNSMMDHYQRTDKRVVANYMLMSIVRGFFRYLSKDIRDLNAPLLKVLYGVTQTRARWKTCVDNMARSFMPTAVGQLYAKAYFTASAKAKALEMIGYIRDSLKQMIFDVPWMDDATKDKALEKADAIIEKVGYPDYQFNDTVLEEFYEDVDYKPDAYFQNAVDDSYSSVKSNSRNLLRTPSRETWSDSASTVNAFYSPSHNAITFPGGILQPPFYGKDFPMSMMFGGIGMVIGHEMTHGFDDEGRKFDKEGNNIPWWSESSVEEYKTFAQCFADQYSQVTVSGGLHVNGNLTLGENIADNGGIKASFRAFEKWQSNNEQEPILPGLNLSHPQLFFVNFAQGWCYLTSEEGARDALLTDPHSPGEVRVRMSACNSRGFADAFGCPPGSPMNPVKKCQLW